MSSRFHLIVKFPKSFFVVCLYKLSPKKVLPKCWMSLSFLPILNLTLTRRLVSSINQQYFKKLLAIVRVMSILKTLTISLPLWHVTRESDVDTVDCFFFFWSNDRLLWRMLLSFLMSPACWNESRHLPVGLFIQKLQPPHRLNGHYLVNGTNSTGLSIGMNSLRARKGMASSVRETKTKTRQKQIIVFMKFISGSEQCKSESLINFSLWA